MGIKTDYLLVLKIINDNKHEISLESLYQKILILNHEYFEMWTRESFYSVIRRLESKEYISTKLMKKIPTAKMIEITKEAQGMLKIFESGSNQDIKKINGKNGKKDVKEIKKKEEKIIIQKEIRDLDDDEIAELTQEVVYKIIDVIDKDIEELTREEGKKYSIMAEKIVRYVRNY